MSAMCAICEMCEIFIMGTIRAMNYSTIQSREKFRIGAREYTVECAT